jgi:hypothetical protein
MYGSYLILSLELLTETLKAVGPSKKKKKGQDELGDALNSVILTPLKQVLKEFNEQLQAGFVQEA